MNKPTRSTRSPWARLALSVTLLSGATGSVTTAVAAPTTKATTRVAKASTAKKGPFPAQSVTDLRTGSTIDLASLNGSNKAVLVWFWAPH